MAKRQLWKAAAYIFGLTIASHVAADNLTGPLVLMDEGSFFVGGDLEQTNAISGNPAGPAGFGYSNTDDIKVDQMYVQFQVPQHAMQNIPIVIIHGCCLTAKTWEDTPDGRMGWAEYFVRNHHAVYLPDQSSRANPDFDATSINEVALGQKPASSLPQIFTFGRVSAWDLFRFGPSYPTPWSDEQFPVEALSDFGNQVIPDLNATLPMPIPRYRTSQISQSWQAAPSSSDTLNSGFFPEQAALTNKSGIKGIISIEGQCPTLNAGQIQTLATIPTLVIFGDHLGGSVVSGSFWVSDLAACQKFVKRLVAAGGNAQLVQLPQLGLRGNSHMLMQDRNNLQIADFIQSWISKNVNQAHKLPMVGKNRTNYN